MGRPRLAEEIAGQVRRRLLSGASITHAAAGLCSHGTARRIASELGITTEEIHRRGQLARVASRRLRPNPNAARDEEIERLYRSEETMEAVGDRQEPPISRERVRQILERRGVPSRPAYFRLPEEVRRKVKARLLQGKSGPDAADGLCSAGTAWRIAVEEGIALPNGIVAALNSEAWHKAQRASKRRGKRRRLEAARLWREGLHRGEIAEAMETSPGAVDQMIRKARIQWGDQIAPRRRKIEKGAGRAAAVEITEASESR